MLHDGVGEDVHAEEAEVVSGTEPRDDEVLFGDGGGGFFDDVGDGEEVALSGDTGASNGSVEGELGFVSWLNG